MARSDRGPQAAAGFSVELDFSPVARLSQVRELEREIEDYADAHDLLIYGTQQRLTVHAQNRPATVEDQVALIDWLVDRPGLSRVRVSPLKAEVAQGGDEKGGYVQVASGDLAVIGVTLLYRLGRLKADQYLQLLGGFVRSALH